MIFTGLLGYELLFRSSGTDFTKLTFFQEYLHFLISLSHRQHQARQSYQDNTADGLQIIGGMFSSITKPDFVWTLMMVVDGSGDHRTWQMRRGQSHVVKYLSRWTYWHCTSLWRGLLMRRGIWSRSSDPSLCSKWDSLGLTLFLCTTMHLVIRQIKWRVECQQQHASSLVCSFSWP